MKVSNIGRIRIYGFVFTGLTKWPVPDRIGGCHWLVFIFYLLILEVHIGILILY